jgi:5-methylcytosine-specific restriction endonuclease McrA
VPCEDTGVSADPFAMMQDAEFVIKFEGVQITLLCKRLRSHRRRFRKAGALLIREKVITAQMYQHWALNKKRTHWTFYGPDRVASIPANEVYWALSGSIRDDADVETYQNGKIIRWRITKRVSHCIYCNIPGEMKPNRLRHICDKCLERLKELEKRLSFGEYDELLHPDKIRIEGHRDRSSNRRWLREFVAPGSFTQAQFKALCQHYGNICLRCRKEKVLVADHVIPLAIGGKNDISNIQPLCQSCNLIKGINSTDYRLRKKFTATQNR